MDIQKIKELALANGFSLKEQASGNMDLHSYVYEFAQAVAAEAKASAVPEGFVLVPKEPTFEMLDAGCKSITYSMTNVENSNRIYRAMIEAAENGGN